MTVVLAIIVAGIVSYFMTPQVKRFAESVGAVDQPSERRINDHPVPRMGGVAIFCGFTLSVLIFADFTEQVQGIMFGAIIIAVMGALDDIYDLSPWIKLGAQIAAAVVCIAFGVVVNAVSGESQGETIYISDILAYVITVGWIVMCTNAINLIDGLDGLACGMSAISTVTLMIVSLFVPETNDNVTIILGCIFGACIGFLPYNWNPAKIFMGDVGSQLLGFLLSTISLVGLFKMHAFVTMLVPIIALAVPLADTAFAFIRRILRGQSPFHADKGHFHHRLLAMGFTQKQVVVMLYGVSMFLGIIAIMMTGEDRTIKIFGLLAAFILALALVLYVTKLSPGVRREHSASSGVLDDEDVKIYEKGSCKK